MYRCIRSIADPIPIGLVTWYVHLLGLVTKISFLIDVTTVLSHQYIYIYIAYLHLKAILIEFFLNSFSQCHMNNQAKRYACCCQHCSAVC